MANVGKRWENGQDGQYGREVELWTMWETYGKKTEELVWRRIDIMDKMANVANLAIMAN